MIPSLDGSHAIVGGLVAVAFWLSRTLYLAVQQRRFQNGHDRRRALNHGMDADTIAWRATISEQMATLIRRVDATREDIHAIRKDDLNPLALRLALVEKEMEHVKRHRS